MKNNLKITTSVVALMAGLPSATLAQQIAIEEIVVTARQRAETLQEIPLSITAFTAADIIRSGVQGFEDLARMTSGIYFTDRVQGSQPGRTANNSVRIRGIQANESASLFIDGVYVFNGVSSIGIADLERVEIIKGPQSAFFGRNTFAGAINYITKSPDLYEYEGHVNTRAGTYKNYEIDASHSGPIIEGKLAYQVSVRSFGKGRMWTTTDGGGLGEQGSDSISMVLYSEPTENLSLKLRFFYQEDEDGQAPVGFLGGTGRFEPFDWGAAGLNNCLGTPFNTLDVDDNPITVTLGSFLCGSVPNPGDVGAPRIDVNSSLRPAKNFEVRPAFDGEANIFLPPAARPNYVIDFLVNGPPIIPGVPRLDHMGQKTDTIRIGFNGDYDFFDGHVLTVTAGYNDTRQDIITDYDQTEVESWYIESGRTIEDYSIEARVASPGEDRFRWLAGATYYYQDYISAGFGRAVNVCIFTCAIGPANLAAAPNSGNKAKVWGIYGSLSYDLTDELTVDIEGRYLEDERITGAKYGTFSNFLTNTFKQKTPRFILNYRPTDETTLYGQYSRGSLPGVTNGIVSICSEDEFLTPYIGINSGVASTASECDQFRAVFPDGELLTASPSQYLDAMEIGWKQTGFEGRLSTSFAGYYYKWKGRPTTQSVQYYRDDNDPNFRDRIPNATPVSQSVTIAGDEKLWGVEFEGNFALDDHWDFDATLSWSKNKIGLFTTNSQFTVYQSSNFRGRQKTRYPNWMGSTSASYRNDFVGDWEWFARGDLLYNGRSFVDLGNLATNSAWFLVNARVGVERDGFRIELYARNLTRQRAWVDAVRGTDFTVPGNLNFTFNSGVSVNPQDKRVFGLRSHYTF